MSPPVVFSIVCKMRSQPAAPSSRPCFQYTTRKVNIRGTHFPTGWQPRLAGPRLHTSQHFMQPLVALSWQVPHFWLLDCTLLVIITLKIRLSGRLTTPACGCAFTPFATCYRTFSATVGRILLTRTKLPIIGQSPAGNRQTQNRTFQQRNPNLRKSVHGIPFTVTYSDVPRNVDVPNGPKIYHQQKVAGDAILPGVFWVTAANIFLTLFYDV